MSIVYLGKATPASGQGGGGSITVDQTYDATSTNAQSGTAVAEALLTISGGLENTATGTNSLTILGTASTYKNTVNIGYNSEVKNNMDTAIGYQAIANGGSEGAVAIGERSAAIGSASVAIGEHAQALNYGDIAIGKDTKIYSGNSYSIVIGCLAEVKAKGAIQLGGYKLKNEEIGTFKVATYDNNTWINNTLLKSNGKIPNDRIDGVSGSFTSQDGKIVTVTNGVITSIVGTSNVNLTFTVQNQKDVDRLIVNGTTYTAEDFDDDAITLQFPSGTSITWSITTYREGASPSQGNLTLTSDTKIDIGYVK